MAFDSWTSPNPLPNDGIRRDFWSEEPSSNQITPAPDICFIPNLNFGQFLEMAFNSPITSYATEGTYIRLTCNSGYQTSSGLTTSHCLPGGFWSPPLGSCEQMEPEGYRCIATLNVQHGQIRFQNSMPDSRRTVPTGTIIILECDQGYQLVDGSNFQQCEANGFWNKPLGHCGR